MAIFTARPVLRTVLAGLATAAVCAGIIALEPESSVDAREQAIDRVSQITSPPQAPDIMVVDIGATSASAMGGWPWPRAELAKLIATIAGAQPKVIALDIVLGGGCGPDDPGNAALANALRAAPATIGFVMADGAATPPVLSPVALRPPVAISDLWQSFGAEQPCPEFIDASQGLASVSLAGNSSAIVRTVPAIIGVGPDLHPGLGTDAIRLASGAGTVIVTGASNPVIAIGDTAAHIDTSGDLRLRASGQGVWASRTVEANDVAGADPQRFKDKIVFIGSSLPQLGALRPTAASPVTPSVQIHADIASGLLRGSLPWRPSWSPLLEALLTLIGGGLVVLAALRLKPMATTGATLAAACLLSVGAILAYHGAGLAFDPLLPACGLLLAGVVSSLSQYSAARAAETAIRISFEQRLPRAIVAKLAKAGADLRLEGEERMVTALFTDIEGFTAMTAAAGPRELIRLLDGYFAGVTRLISESGGMVDKIVGDAVHAFFNMPLDLENHQGKALECAEAILAFSESYRQTPEARRFGFGRTRIGIETGRAVVGDVGGHGKIDYTAYGDAVNIAARLQEANKQTGTSILAGPGIRSASPAGWVFDSPGTFDIRGLGPMDIFAPRREGAATPRKSTTLLLPSPARSKPGSDGPHDGVIRLPSPPARQDEDD